MGYRTWVSPTICFALLFPLLHAVAFAQQEPTTADEVVTKYLEAVGASHFSSVTTLTEMGDLDGNLKNFWVGSESPVQSQNRDHGTFEFYFKSPNLRFSSNLSENKVIFLHGCDGRVAWYIDAYLNRTEIKPKPGSAFECEEGFKPALSVLHESKLKMRLLKKKAVGGSMAWEIKVDDPKSPGSEKLYFDTETFLLLRSQKLGSSVTYSDYRDVGGIKVPFKVTRESTNSKLVTTVRELKINTPIDDARFVEPKVKDRVITYGEVASTKNESAAVHDHSSTAVAVPNAEVPAALPSKEPASSDATSIVEVNFPNFTSCAIKELQLTVPELKGLKPAANQEELATLLDKIGARTLDIARNTPNLIARETVVLSRQGARETQRDYDYLILPRVTDKVVGLDEFRVDLKSGDKFQTDEATKKESSTRTDLERASSDVTRPQTGRAPASQGFATSWVHFYPLNRSQATFRYLGEGKVDGRRMLVLAFAQKPESVISPGIVQYQGKLVPMFLQGVAWVDPSDFRILRLRTDLLVPVPEVSLHRLTADIQFGLTRIEKVPSPLSLPREVRVTSEIGGSSLRETHKYSGYRLFRAQSKVVLNP